MVKQASIDNFMTVETGTSSTHTQLDHGASLPKRSQLGRINSLNAASRPAQLEAVGEQIGRHAFDARKRALDALYRKSRRELPTPARIGLERLIGHNLSSESSNKHTGDSSSGDGPKDFNRSRTKAFKVPETFPASTCGYYCTPICTC